MTCSLCRKKYRLKAGAIVQVTVRVALEHDNDTAYAHAEAHSTADICPACCEDLMGKVEANHAKVLAEAAKADNPPAAPPTEVSGPQPGGVVAAPRRNREKVR